MHMSASLFFANFLMKKKTPSRALTVRDVCFSKPMTFRNGFMFFVSRSCFKHFFIPQATLLLRVKQGSRSGKVLETAMRSKNMKPLRKVQRLRKGDIMESKCSRRRFFHEKMSKNSDAGMYIYIVYVCRDLESVCDTPHQHTQPNTPTKHQPHTNTHHTHMAHTHTTHTHTLVSGPEKW